MEFEHLTDYDIEKMAIEVVQCELNIDNSHILQCSKCRNKLDYYIDFYLNLESELNKESHKDIDQLLKKSEYKNNHELKYYTQKYDDKILNTENGSIILAAKSDSNISRFTKQAVYLSDSGELMVRILKDNTTHKYILFILTNIKCRFLCELWLSDGSIIDLGDSKNNKIEFELTNSISWEKTKVLLKEFDK